VEPQFGPDLPVERPGWRETLTGATDLALVGIGVLVLSLPVLTAPAAVTAGSAAAAHWCRERDLPRTTHLLRIFRRGLRPGLLPAVVVAALFVVLVVDLRAVVAGAVPGGALLGVAELGCAAAALTVLGLAVVRAGARPGVPWADAVRWALRTARRHPRCAVAVFAVELGAGLIAVFVPVTAPLALGYALLGLHAVTGRSVLTDED